MTVSIARLAPVLALAALTALVAGLFAAPAFAVSTFQLVAVDATKAKVSGATLTPLDVSGGSLDYSTRYTMGNAKGTASMQGSVNGDVLEGTLKVEVRITDNYGTEFFTIEEMAFTSTSLSDSDGTVDIILGAGTVKTNDSEREFYSGQRISYRIIVPGAPPQEETLEDSGIRFSDIAGLVQVLPPSGYDDSGEPIYDDEDSWNFAKLDMPLPWGTKIKLGERSAILLSWPDMTSFQFKTPDNDDAVIQLPLRPKKDDIMRLLAGNLWTNVKKMVKDGSMDIEMGQAVAGIKGTTFILTDDGTTSTLKVIEGTVRFKSKVNGTEMMVKAREMVAATVDGLGKKQTFDMKAETAAFGGPTRDAQEALSFRQMSWLLPFGACVVVAGIAALFALRKKSAALKR